MPAADISVIIPTYNRAGLIAGTLDSILGQELKAAEVIVVDDGSTDDTGRVVAAYAGRVRYVRLENGGACRARNLGVRAARGRWIAFCDSDDVWLPEKLRVQMEIVEKAPETQFLFTNFRTIEGGAWSERAKLDSVPDYFDGVEKRELGPGLLLVTGSLYHKVAGYFAENPSTVLMTKGLFEAVGGFDERFSRMCGEDVEFVLRCVRHPPVGVVTRPVVGIRRHEGNISAQRLFMLQGFIEILEYARAHHDAPPEAAEVFRREIRSHRLEAAELAYTAGEYELVPVLLKPLVLREMPWKTALKYGVCLLPGPVRGPLAGMLGAPARTRS